MAYIEDASPTGQKRRAQESDTEDVVRWHGQWRGERRIMLHQESDIEETHMAIYDAEPQGNSTVLRRMFVVTGPKMLFIRHAILEWAAARGITIV